MKDTNWKDMPAIDAILILIILYNAIFVDVDRALIIGFVWFIIRTLGRILRAVEKQ